MQEVASPLVPARNLPWPPQWDVSQLFTLSYLLRWLGFLYFDEVTTMSDPEKRVEKDTSVNVDAVTVDPHRKGHNTGLLSLRHADDVLLAKLGYKSEFRREFSVSSP